MFILMSDHLASQSWEEFILGVEKLNNFKQISTLPYLLLSMVQLFCIPNKTQVSFHHFKEIYTHFNLKVNKSDFLESKVSKK